MTDDHHFQLAYPITRDKAAGNFLKLFYPFHYAVGMEVEKSLSGGVLDRHQTVILWFLHSRSGPERSLPRKLVEQLIGEWYDLGSPAISKVLRRMMQEPLAVVDIRESAASAREKVIHITPRGETVINDMMRRGEAIIQRIVDELSDVQVHIGLEFLERVSTIVTDFD